MATKEEKAKRRPSRVLMHFYLFFLALSIVIIGRIYHIQHVWEPNPKHIEFFLPAKQMEKITPRRGTVIDHNGKLLAISTPLYEIRMDCSVQKKIYAKDEENGKALEAEWCAKAGRLAEGLAEILKETDSKGNVKDAEYYRNAILRGRNNNNGYLLIAKEVNHRTLEELKKLPLFNEVSHKGGLIVKPKDNRLYPYGSLARRVIGYVSQNDTSGNYIGIEGKYNYLLKGKEGVAWARKTDKSIWINDIDSTNISAENGMDVRTTIDINIQDIAERALRENLAEKPHINSSCIVIMEVETGAIRAMVNLQRDSLGRLAERYNIATSQPSEPGSVFKTIMLTTMIEDGLVSLDDKIKVGNGRMEDVPSLDETDGTLLRYASRNGISEVPVIDGFKISSNMVFRRLVKDNYEDNPEELIARLHSYNLGANFNFDIIEKGSGRSSIPDYGGSSWNGTTLVSMAIGYAVKVTPLQVATFYNALANGGVMMKPYIVESIEKDGKVIEKTSPVAVSTVCSKATADTMKRAMLRVTQDRTGTGWRLNAAKCKVAGKTGTSFIHLTPAEQAGGGTSYKDKDGKRKHQGSFAGFFPAEDPKYTAIIVTYTDLMDSSQNEHGGSVAASTLKMIIDELWTYDQNWRREIDDDGTMPEKDEAHIPESEGGKFPDLRGLGLQDAIYMIESSGYRCEYTGKGHVTKQTMITGKDGNKTIKIVLE